MIRATPYKIIPRKPAIFVAAACFPSLLVLAGWQLGFLPDLAPMYGPIVAAALICTLVLLWFSMMLILLRRRQKRSEGLMILGMDPLALDLCRRAAADGMVGYGEETIDCHEINALSIERGSTRIVVAESDPLDRQQLATALIDCKLRGVAVEEAGSFHEKLTRKLWVKKLSSDWWIYSDGFQPSRVYLWHKRVLDILCASTMIVVTSPLLLLIAIAIKLDSPGPSIFSQERVGLRGLRFTLYKFRSMKTDAEAKSGPAWSSEGDDRATRLGKILRKYRLDEIPQAFNVLRGDMSLAGPRPERPYFVEMLNQRVPNYSLRHYAKPGITGWAQVLYPYGATVEDAIEKLQYDLYYIKHMSFGQDVLILLKTVSVVLFGRGL
jgi:exopolysaccharide biosynthesis polyprenyl glycosylphosphotransferase